MIVGPHPGRKELAATALAELDSLAATISKASRQASGFRIA
jgi:hypothetical protein